MSLDLIETSDISGAPVELYEITYSGTAWRYTSADHPIVYNLRTYEPLSIYRSALRPALQKEKADLTLNLPITAEVGTIFRASPPGEVVMLTVYRQHTSDVDAQTMVVWVGRIINCKYDQFEIEFLCESIMSSMQRTMLTRTYQRGCPYVLFGDACKVNGESYKVASTVDSIAGTTVDIAAAPADGFLAGGYLEYTSYETGVVERRFIAGNTGGVLQLDRQPAGLLAGMPLLAYPGCDHTLTTCKNKFNNVDNFGGQPYIPTKNPFGNAPIY